MNLDDFIRGLLNISPNPGVNPHHHHDHHHRHQPRTSRSDDDGGEVGQNDGARDDYPAHFDGRSNRDGNGGGVDGFYDFDRFIERQMRSVFAPFFGGGGGRDSLWSGFSNPAISDDPGNVFSVASLLSLSGYRGLFPQGNCSLSSSPFPLNLPSSSYLPPSLDSRPAPALDSRRSLSTLLAGGEVSCTTVLVISYVPLQTIDRIVLRSTHGRRVEWTSNTRLDLAGHARRIW